MRWSFGFGSMTRRVLSTYMVECRVSIYSKSYYDDKYLYYIVECRGSVIGSWVAAWCFGKFGLGDFVDREISRGIRA